ncbi:unnamed protein product [Boreogadus saida]
MALFCWGFVVSWAEGQARGRGENCDLVCSQNHTEVRSMASLLSGGGCLSGDVVSGSPAQDWERECSKKGKR